MRDALKYPPLLTDLGHVGRNGLPLNSDPGFQHEIEQCREWGFRLEISGDKVRLVYDQEQLVPYWIQKETPAVAWDWLRVSLLPPSVDKQPKRLTESTARGAGGTLVYAEEQTEEGEGTGTTGSRARGPDSVSPSCSGRCSRSRHGPC